MKKLLLVVALLGFYTMSQAASTQPPKYLHYKYNDNVVITISNVPCMLAGIKDQYDWAVRADRVDGNKLIGCFKKLDEDTIRIQWYKGDFTDLPANVFLQPKQQDVEKIAPPPTL